MIVVWTTRLYTPPETEAYLRGWLAAGGRGVHRESKIGVADAPGLWLPDWERFGSIYVPWTLWDSLAHPDPDPAEFQGWTFYYGGGYDVHYRRYVETSSGVERVDEVRHFTRERVEQDEAAGEMHPTVGDVLSTKN